ncbi:hypothetical protein E2542_SST31052 [Spatholobus suberectus]|nr:hypothetical protein E2542_SST31052 [Spatholobus suberectus]
MTTWLTIAFPSSITFVMPNNADMAPLNVSICLHAFGNVGYSLFSGVEFGEYEGMRVVIGMALSSFATVALVLMLGSCVAYLLNGSQFLSLEIMHGVELVENAVVSMPLLYKASLIICFKTTMPHFLLLAKTPRGLLH